MTLIKGLNYVKLKNEKTTGTLTIIGEQNVNFT